MTRINTNVSSLLAQHALAKSNNELQEALTRLSTGLRINKGKDDPAGLIASELLRSDIISVGRAITNSEQANQLVATADSALGQVSSLLNDIRGLVSEAANTGALSDDQIEANQLQIDSSLEAINRIAQTTSFQGRRLLDGNLDFLTSGVDQSKINNLNIEQANFGSFSEITVDLEIRQQATRGQLNFGFGAVSEDVVLQVGGQSGAEAFSFAAGSSINEIANAINLVSDATGVEAEVEQAATQGSLTVSSFGENNDIVLTANDAGFDAGNVRVKYITGDSTGTTVNFTEGSGSDPATLEVALQTRAYEAATATIDDGNLTAQNGKYHVYASGADNDFDIEIDSSLLSADLANTLTVNFTANAGTAVIASAYTASTNTLTIDVGTSGSPAYTLSDFTTALEATTGVDAGTFTAAYSDYDAAGTNGAHAGTGGYTGGTTTFSAGERVADAIGAVSNNALEFATLLKGSDFNGANVQFVDDDLVSLTGLSAGSETVQYNHDATKAQAILKFGGDDDLVVTAATAGTDFNNVSIRFVDSGDVTGNSAVATYDADSKVLTIDVDDGTTDLDAVIAAFDDLDEFDIAENDTANFDGSTTVDTADLYYTGTGITGNTGYTGGEAGTLFIGIEQGVTTAADVVAALAAGGNSEAAALFDFALRTDNDGTGGINAGAFSSAFSGGVDGGDVIATANEVVEALNNDADASAVLTASLAEGDDGYGVVDAFQEFAYTGSAEANNRLQFLGLEGSQNIRFTAVAGQSLGVDLTTDPRVEANSSATLQAENANASLVFQALNKGEDYDDVIVRFKQAANGADDTVTFDQEESYAQAELSFTGSDNSFFITSAERGDALNGVTIKLEASIAGAAGDNATASYDADTNTLTLAVEDDDSTTAAALRQAIEDTGLFTTSLSYNGDNGNDGSGTIAASDASNEFASTGDTGGHRGTLEITVDAGTTADDVIALVQGDDYVNKYFYLSNFGSSDGSGAIDFTEDTNKAVTSGGISSEGTVIINLETDAGGVVQTTANDLIAYFDDPANAATLSDLGISVSNAGGSDGTGKLSATSEDLVFSTSGTELTDTQASGTVSAVNGVNARFTVTALNAGSDYDDVTVVFQNTPGITGGGDEVAEYEESSKTLRIQIAAGTTTAADVVSAINDIGGETAALFSAELVGTGAELVDLSDTGSLSGGVTDTGAEDGASLIGNSDLANVGLTFHSAQYGSDAFVSVKALSGTFALTDADGADSERSNGTDVDARINGIKAVGDGLKASINTSSLDASFNVDSSVADGTTTSFRITGGGALFQLGPEVVSNQQARLGISAVSTATLGGTAGKLFELASGGSKSIANDVKAAAAVVDEVITQVTKLRGRLGAFQRTTLETNISTLQVTLENLTEAESAIRDADFAQESARLTRAQILVQSGTSVLAIANSNPQNVLSLLRG